MRLDLQSLSDDDMELVYSFAVHIINTWHAIPMIVDHACMMHGEKYRADLIAALRKPLGNFNYLRARRVNVLAKRRFDYRVRYGRGGCSGGKWA